MNLIRAAQLTKQVRHLFVAVAVAASVPLSAVAGSILTSDAGYFGYRVGGSNWTEFTAKLETASGGNVSFAPNFDNLAQMLNYDALLLPARNPVDILGAPEIANIKAYIATGRRVLLFGENDNWNGWDQQVVSIAGGSYISEPYNTYWAYSSSIVSNDITKDANSIMGFWVGVADGGEQLYSGKNFVTLWGTSKNVLTILDENVVEDAYQAGFGDDAKFTTNVANWLAGESTQVPEPATLALVGAALVGVAATRRRRK
jgi:hypothetical protein